MKCKWLFLLFLLVYAHAASASRNMVGRKIGLEEVRALILQNRSVILETYNKKMAQENLKQKKTDRLPDFSLGGDGFLNNKTPLSARAANDNHLVYHFNLSSEFDVYTGGAHTYAIERARKDQQLSEESLHAMEEEVLLEAYILLYDIHRNIKYLDFIRSSIHLREKEYERINQLYVNGVVLKSDLLRSKLYITDLQKDEINIENSIDILSDKLCALLGIKERFTIEPVLDNDLKYAVSETFDDLYRYALEHSPHLQIYHTQKEKEEVVLKQIKTETRPQLKLYAQYGVGSSQPVFDYKHQLGGEIGAKVSLSLSALYKTKHKKIIQKQRIERHQIILEDKEEKLRNTLKELYTRYHESLVNIDRAIEKINMSKESYRILRNSYFNQQALLIDVLESETKNLEAGFEWVQAVVDSQKYYWAIKQISGQL